MTSFIPNPGCKKVKLMFKAHHGKFCGAGRNQKSAKASAARAALAYLKKKAAEADDGIDD